MKVTFGLCVKNSERTIGDTICSVIEQFYPHEEMEIIVVDGNSSDSTCDIVKTSLFKTKIRSRVFSDRGRGLGTARQMVIDQSTGEYIIYLGDDVTLPKDFLRTQVEFMDSNPRVGAAIPESEYKKCQKNFVTAIQNLLFSVIRNMSNGTILRRIALNQVGGFDLNIKGASEDTELMFRIKCSGWKVIVNSKAKFFHGRKETLRSLHRRYFWYGYGDHFTNHKHKNMYKVAYYLPPSRLIWGLKLSPKAYRKYHEKKAFLIPVFCFFASISWCLGLLISHFDGYGHLV